MPKFLAASACSLSLWLLLACSAHAGPFEECSLGEDFEFTHNWNSEDHERILRGCSAFIKQAPGDTKKLAIAYTNRGNARKVLERESAIADYTKAIEIDPRHADAYYRRGNVYSVADLRWVRNWKRAISDYDKAIEIDPSHRWAYGRRAYAYEEQGSFDRAIADYTKHIEVNPKDAVRGYWLRARAYHRSNDYDGAIADLSKVIEIDKIIEDGEVVGSRYNGYGARANAYFDKKDYDRAIADYTKIMEIFDERTMEHQRASMWRVRARSERGDYEYAIAEYTRMIASGPSLAIGHAIPYSERARIYFKTGKTAQAHADAEKAMKIAQGLLKLHPDGAHGGFDIRGHVYETLGKRDEAIADYRKALKLNPFQAEWSEIGLKRLGAEP